VYDEAEVFYADRRIGANSSFHICFGNAPNKYTMMTKLERRPVFLSNQCHRNNSWTNVHVAWINEKRHQVAGSSDGHSELEYFPNIITLKWEIPVQRQHNYPYLNSKNDYVSILLCGNHQVIKLKALWRTVGKLLIIQIIHTDVK